MKMTMNYDDLLKALRDERFAQENKLLLGLVNQCRKDKRFVTRFALLELITVLSRRNPDCRITLSVLALADLLNRSYVSIHMTLNRLEKKWGAIFILHSGEEGGPNVYWPRAERPWPEFIPPQEAKPLSLMAHPTARRHGGRIYWRTDHLV
jgi:hypothetical protein